MNEPHSRIEVLAMDEIFNVFPIVIINGKGGCGKDTLINLLDRSKFHPIVLSTVDEIKRAAEILGWNDHDKSDAARKFLSDIKSISQQFNNYPNRYIVNTIENQVKFLMGALRPGSEFGVTRTPVFFIHCREPENIFRLIHDIAASETCVSYCKAPITLLVRRAETTAHTYNNVSDDNVELYPYDCVIENDGTPEDGAAKLERMLLAVDNIILSKTGHTPKIY